MIGVTTKILPFCECAMKHGSRLAPGPCWSQSENEAVTSGCGGGVNITKQQAKPKTQTTCLFLKTSAKHVVKEAAVVHRGDKLSSCPVSIVRVLFSCIKDLITSLIQKLLEQIFIIYLFGEQSKALTSSHVKKHGSY